MIKFLTLEQQLRLTPRDLVGKYIWRDPRHPRDADNAKYRWTAVDYPHYISEVFPVNVFTVDPEARVMYQREKPVFSQNLDMYIMTGDGKRKDDGYDSIKHVVCVCDTPRDVNTVRLLGKVMRQEYETFWNGIGERFQELDNTHGVGGQGTIRMVVPDERVYGHQIKDRYVFLRTTRWTAADYPKYVQDLVPVRGGGETRDFNGIQEAPYRVPETGEYIITGEGARKDRRSYGVSQIKCICNTPRDVNTVRALGAIIRAEHNQFWLDVKTRFKALDPQYQVDDVVAPRL
jgi:hypothetical protein